MLRCFTIHKRKIPFFHQIWNVLMKVIAILLLKKKRANERRKWKGITFFESAKYFVCSFARFFHRLCKFMKMFSVIFSNQIHKHLSANLHVSDVNVEHVKVHGISSEWEQKTRVVKMDGPFWPFASISFRCHCTSGYVTAKWSFSMGNVTSKSLFRREIRRNANFHASMRFHREK